MIHLHRLLRRSKLMETESRLMVYSNWGSGRIGSDYSWIEFFGECHKYSKIRLS